MVWTKEKIDERCDAFILKYGRRPKYKEMGISKGFGLPSPGTIQSYCGDINKYFEKKNATKNIHKYTKEGIAIAIEIVFKDLGRFPTYRDLEEISKNNKNIATPNTIATYFPGGLKEVAKYINLDIILRWDKKSIIRKMLPLLEKNNMSMFANSELDKIRKDSTHSVPCYNTIKKHFGSIDTFCDEIGITRHKQQNNSVLEKEIIVYVNSIYGGESILASKSVLGDGRELDIYLPDIGLAIECNGNYWHSYNNKHTPKNENYHVSKTLLAKEKGITLIHIWENEWGAKQEEIKEYLSLVISGEESLAVGDEDGLIEVDNMKPIKYSNVSYMWDTDPELIDVGKEQCWNCGTTVYEVR